MPHPGLVTRYTSCTHMDRSRPLLYVHVGQPVQQTKAAWWPWPLTSWPWSGVRVMCDVGYLCAHFGLGASLFSTWARCMRQTDRQTSDVKQKYRSMPRLLAGHKNYEHYRRSQEHFRFSQIPTDLLAFVLKEITIWRICTIIIIV